MKHLTAAFTEENQWWRYLIVFIIAMFGGQTIGAIPLIVVIFYSVVRGNHSEITADNMMDLSAYGIDSNLGLALMIFPFIASLIFLLMLIKPFHKRSYLTLFSGDSIIRWKRFFTSSLIWFALMGVYVAVDYYINPQTYSLNFDASSFFILIFVAVLLIPFQASFEEIFFRGYLAQGVAAWTKSRVMVIIIPSVLFGLMHSFNPEIKEYGFWIMMPQYIIIAAVFALISVLDDGIEIAMGAHSANNVFLSIFVTSKASALQTSALLVLNTVEPVKDLIMLIVLCSIFTFIIYKLYNFNFKQLTERIK